MKEIVYIYNIKDKDKLRKMHVALLPLRIKLKTIADGHHGQKVGFIAELDGYEEETASSEEIPAVTDEILLMKNLTSARIDDLLAAFRKAGVPRIKLKAALTETNKDWYFYELCQELQREHEKLNQKNS